MVEVLEELVADVMPSVETIRVLMSRYCETYLI